MLTESQTSLLEQAWGPARASGALGGASIDDLCAHTAGYVSAVCARFGPDVQDLALKVVDVGTGAGVPGVLLALTLPGCEFVLMDAQERRCDLARHAVAQLGLTGRVVVEHCRADEVGQLSSHRGRFDVAVARLLGPPAESVELLAPLVADGGLVVLSAGVESLGDWGSYAVARAACAVRIAEPFRQNGFVSLDRVGQLDASLPRRTSVRRRSPLF